MSDEKDDILRYDLMVERALRAVVRDSLEVAAQEGLPGEHHFYITFRTDFPGVEISEGLRTRYNEEMTVVIQHQFWDLAVAEDYFAITLSFSGRPERLVVPYESITAFADPSVRFGLQFESLFGGEEDDDDHEDEDEETANLDLGPGNDAEEIEEELEPKGPAAEKAVKDSTKDEKGNDKVVTLDSFRKK